MNTYEKMLRQPKTMDEACEAETKPCFNDVLKLTRTDPIVAHAFRQGCNAGLSTEQILVAIIQVLCEFNKENFKEKCRASAEYKPDIVEMKI